jgi:hypothetical protein
MSNPTRIDLERYRDGGVRVFAGRSRGRVVRQAAKLDELEAIENAAVEIHIPDDVYSVTSSFFLGMFGDSIRKLSEAGFRRVYTFSGRDVSKVIDDAIQAVLTVPSSLAVHLASKS